MPALAAAVSGAAPCTSGRQQHQCSAAAALAPCRLRQRPFFGDASLLAQPSGRPSSSGRQLQAAVSNVAAPDQKTMEKAVFGKGKVVKVRGCRLPPAAATLLHMAVRSWLCSRWCCCAQSLLVSNAQGHNTCTVNCREALPGQPALACRLAHAATLPPLDPPPLARLSPPAGAP
jgi:hypothetical protein